MKIELKLLLVSQNSTIEDAIRTLMRNGCGVAFVIDDRNRLVGVVTDGDVRKGTLAGRQISEGVMTIFYKNPLFVKENMSDSHVEDYLKNFNRKEKLRTKIQRGGTLKVPVVNEDHQVVNVLFVSIKDEGKHIIECDLNDVNKIKNFTGAKTVLITGGGGYLGSLLSRKLLERGYKVRVLDNLTYNDEGIKDLYYNSGFEFVEGDIRDIQTVVESIKDVDAVIHLAAIVGDPATSKFPQETIDVNYLATKALGDVCKYYQVNRFLFASTCSVYGKTLDEDEVLSTSSSTTPLSLYAKMKLKSEDAIMSLADNNFSPTILRMATLYGVSPRMRFDLVVNLLTAQSVVEKSISIFGGEQWRPFLHVEDAAMGYIKCLELPFDKVQGRIFNLGDDRQNFRICEIGDMIKKISPETKVNVSSDKVDSRNYRVSFDDVSKYLDFRATYDVSKGILEIKEQMLNGDFLDYTDGKYSNVRFR